uniref:DNA-directed RNA polymerase n=1 Tax=Codium simulans TaxID=589376 RepID=A0A1I9LKK2_9CHLO|nr:DNA-directed RNA polymerase [Codium simulans]ANJ70863.1 DNA-directed RNA polymerase [Codium simulans]
MITFFDRCFEKKRLKQLLLWFYHEQGEYKTLKLLEKLKSLGFKYATQSGLSIGLEDLQLNLQKSEIMRFTEYEMQQIEINTVNANVTNFEKWQQMITIWINKSEQIKKKIIKNFKISKNLNPLYLMAFSGARGNMSQVRQLVGIRGLMSDPQGNILDFPIRSNFREGLTLTEYIISCYGARKGIVDTALRTATSGYLTRRLVDVAQHVFIERQNCETSNFIWIKTLYHEQKVLKNLNSRLIGRALAKNILIKKSQNHFAVNSCITFPIAKKLTAAFNTLPIRSPLICDSLNSICQFCYGWNLASEKLVSLGEAIGILAAQSIGEPGTQLTMRTFHTGGVFSGAAIEQIYSPCNGYIAFSTLILGHLIRTSSGQIAFLTKQDSFFILKHKLNKFLFNIPTCSLIYIKQNEYVLKEQLLAQLQVSEPSMDQPTYTEQHTYTDYSGQILFENITILQKKNSNSILRQYTQTLGTIWIAKALYSEFVVNYPIRAQNLDLINESVSLQKFNILFHNLIVFCSKKGLFLNKISQSNSKIKFLDFKTYLDYKHIYFKNKCYFFVYFKHNLPFLNLKFFTLLNAFKNNHFNNLKSSYLKILYKNFRTHNTYLPISFNANTYYQQKLITLKTNRRAIRNCYHCYWKQIFVQTQYFFCNKIQTKQLVYSFNLKHIVLYSKHAKFKNYKQNRFNFFSIPTLPTLLYTNVCKHYKYLLFVFQNIYRQNLKILKPSLKMGKLIKIQSKIQHNFKNCIFKKKNHNLEYPIWYFFFNLPYQTPKYKLINFASFKIRIFYFVHFSKFFITNHICKNLGPRYWLQKKKIYFVKKRKLKSTLIGISQIKAIWKNSKKIQIKKHSIHSNTLQKSTIFGFEFIHFFFESYFIKKFRKINEYLHLKTLTKYNSKCDLLIYSPCLLWDAQILNLTNFKSTQSTKNCVFKIMKQKHIDSQFKITLIYYTAIHTSEFLFHNSDNLIVFLNLNHFRTFHMQNRDLSLFLGQFFQTTNKYSISGITQPGLIYALTKTKVVLRKAEPKLLSANGIVHVQHRTFVKENSYFFTMFYTYYQTGDIVQGIPRIEDFFEARHQFYNNPAFTDLQTRLIYFYNKYRIQYIHEKAVRKAILKIQTIIVDEVQTIYSLQGIVISDKHIEIIVRQMTSKVRITSSGSTGLLIGELVDLLWIEKINCHLKVNKIQYDPVILGITKTCLETSSFISAASFQETIRVLTQAAVQNKLDFICGLKENVILGHLIPVGTGFFSF